MPGKNQSKRTFLCQNVRCIELHRMLIQTRSTHLNKLGGKKEICIIADICWRFHAVLSVTHTSEITVCCRLFDLKKKKIKARTCRPAKLRAKDASPVWYVVAPLSPFDDLSEEAFRAAEVLMPKWQGRITSVCCDLRWRICHNSIFF